MQLKTVVVIDGGGRGSALVDAYAKSKKVQKIIAIPGNDLMQINTSKKVLTFQNLKTTSIEEIIEICQKHKVDLIDVAQDNAIQVGLVNRLINEGFKVMGPTKEAGRIEWDKAWSRELMQKYKIPSPRFKIFNSTRAGINFVTKEKNESWVVKASGLAEGKGVIITSSKKQTIEAIKQMEKFGIAGETFLLEEALVGEEFSAFAICSGIDFKVIGFAQDHKRVYDKDTGPNTGGMGCVSNPLVTDKNIRKQTEKIFKEILKGLKKETGGYRGILYLGGMVVKGEQVFVIEFNARWGDPEAEVLLPGIQNDLLELSMAVIKGKVNRINLKTDNKRRISIAACSRGYPVDYVVVRGKEIFGIEKLIKIKGIKLYGAGVKKEGKQFLANGGRLFYIVADGGNILEIKEKAYGAMSQIFIEGNNLHFRTDIGWRDIDRMYKI